ncbi:type IV pilin N-terminal domain-containing protein [Halomicroarcula limicola]|uniref:Type IV pilin N-terminal domain-containing protein n=1 Tax=Haloarcula limicola TaxID=1429915 RepID=A0A8J7Y8N3_9EURY|nr:type IV pilin N-terminal domain-containing protein [Halomicroarcula limicola]MBV0923284.1 type IV pilin N-terminal domain-containing protein [Halomicroarcula limicola]
MDIKRLINDDDAVSPVIGVILMVAITVILAAVIATFVLGLGENLSNTAPQASFSFDYEKQPGPKGWNNSQDGDGTLTVTHDGGDSINAENLHIKGSQDDGAWDVITGENVTTAQHSTGASISAGTSIKVNVANSDTVRVVFESSESGSSATLSKWSGPSA